MILQKYYLDGNDNPRRINIESNKFNMKCPHCGESVLLEWKMDYQKCPNCHKYFKPCALCENKCDCSNCRLDRNF